MRQLLGNLEIVLNALSRGRFGYSPPAGWEMLTRVSVAARRFGTTSTLGGEAKMSLDPALLEILACPECTVRVELDGERLVCVRCGRQYPIQNGIPIMLVDEAEPPATGWQPKEE